MTLVAAPSDTLRVAVLGCGNVGGALVGAAGPAVGIEIVSALVRDPSRPRAIPRAQLRTTLDGILADRPDVVVECLGGIDEAAAMGARVLDAGIDLVTANKSMLAHALPSLAAAARRSGALLHADASVCAGVPVLDAVARLRWAGIRSITGIVNGTCNLVLDSLAQPGATFEGAVARAVQLGYAEPDPSADLSGRDAAEKACLLAAAAGLGTVRPGQVAVVPLAGAGGAPSSGDLAAIRAHGHAVRCVARVERTADGVRVGVAPTVVQGAGPLAQAAGTENVVVVQTDLAGTVTLRGPGAGANPTVAALLADIVACRERRQGWATTVPLAPAAVVADAGDVRAVACIEGWTGTPDRLLATLRGAGAAVGGCGSRRSNWMVDLAGPGPVVAVALHALRVSGARVQSFEAEEGVVLRF